MVSVRKDIKCKKVIIMIVVNQRSSQGYKNVTLCVYLSHTSYFFLQEEPEELSDSDFEIPATRRRGGSDQIKKNNSYIKRQILVIKDL